MRTRAQHSRADTIAEAVTAMRIVSQAAYVPSTCNERVRSRRVRPMRIAGLAACVALSIAGCSSTTEPTTASPATTTATSAPKESALKTIDPKAFQAVVEAAADKLMVPGAMVLLRTPQGNFNAAVGTTELKQHRHHRQRPGFRIASNTKTMTAALIVLLAQDGKLKFSDPVSA